MFSVSKVRYAKTRRGVVVDGQINFNAGPVGYFEQRPYAACVPYLNQRFAEFREAAEKSGMTECDYCEKLLEQWENACVQSVKAAKKKRSK
jgi:hypothetical protein